MSQLIIPLLFFPLLIQERRAFFGCAEQGPLPSYSTWTQLGDFSCCRAWALGPVGLWSCSTQPSVLGAPGLESTGSVFVVHRLSFPEACGIFPSQGSNCVSRIGRWILYPPDLQGSPRMPFSKILSPHIPITYDPALESPLPRFLTSPSPVCGFLFFPYLYFTSGFLPPLMVVFSLVSRLGHGGRSSSSLSRGRDGRRSPQ